MKFESIVFAVATILSSTAAAQRGEPIGEVLSMEGRWCREAALSLGKPVYLEDDITYCGVPRKTTDTLVIRFYSKPPGQTPYDRTYTCATPGTCDARLFLKGAYIFRTLPSPPGKIPISAPRTEGFLSDTVIEAGSQIPGASWLHSGFAGKIGGRAPVICRFSIEPDNIVPCVDLVEVPHLGPGIYGVFERSGAEAPAAILGIVPPNSKVLGEWHEVPYAYKADRTQQTVIERRTYLLDLLRGELK